MRRRIARDGRRAGVRAVLGPRDEALVRALARLRLARTADLLRLFFPGVRPDTAARRLRRLHDAGFLGVRSCGLNEQNIYQLGPHGADWVEARGVAAGKPPVPPATHHLSTVRLWTQLAVALKKDTRLRLSRFEPDWELR